MLSHQIRLKPVCPTPRFFHTTCHRAALLLALGMWGGHLLLLALILFTGSAFAAGTDILLGAEEDMLATVKGTARIIFYIVELVAATATYIKSRSPMVFAGTVVLALFFEAFLKIFLDTTVS